MSLIISTPSSKTFFIVKEFLVSQDILIYFYNSFIIGNILSISKFTLIGLAPGLVDSPPTSIISAPSSINLSACLKLFLY